MQTALGFLGFSDPYDITLELDDAGSRRLVLQNGSDPNAQAHPHSPAIGVVPNASELLPLFRETETIGGRVTLAGKDGKPAAHRGVRIEFVGAIQMLYDRERSQEFVTQLRHLDDPGTLSGQRQYSFEFTDVEKKYETYAGIAVRLRYFLRVTVARAQYTADAVREFDVCVQHVDADASISPPPASVPIRMEVGIENALHIEFEYNKNKYHLQDLVIGKIYFVTVQIQIKRMEMEIRKKELAGAGVNTVSESETMLKFEVMDGAPVQGESIPVRMFLQGSKSLTPTYRSVNNKFSVKYFLNLVLVDVDDRRYFKQSEITLWRAAYS